LSIVALSFACDGGGDDLTPTAALAELQPEPDPELLEPEGLWQNVPTPVPIATDPLTFEAPAPADSEAMLPWTLENFYFASADDDYLAISTAPDVLFAPFPDGIQPLPPEIDDGFILAFTLHDEQGNVIGFGSEQEVLDLENAYGHTTYTLTINGRGTLIFAQDEDFAWLLDEVDDMVADQEFVREYDPAIVEVSTVPGTNRIIGGTGEFAGAKGWAREFSIVNKLDLITREHDTAIALQVLYF
jgi:hypothetical protein